MEKEEFKFRLAGKTLVLVDWANVYGWFKNLGWEIDPKLLFEYLSTYPEVYEQRLYHGSERGKIRSEDFKNTIAATGFIFISKEVKWVPVSLDKSHFKILVKELFDVLDGIKNTNSEIADKLYQLRAKVEGRLSERKPGFDSDKGEVGEYRPYTPEDGEIYDSTYQMIEELDTELKKLNLSIVELQKHLSAPVKRRKCDFDVEIARDVCNECEKFEQVILFSGDGDYAALGEDLIKKGRKVIVVFASGHLGKEYEGLKNQISLWPVGLVRKHIIKQNPPGTNP
jgi:uncharacterized LabA/DUF88 family protein